ALIASPDEVFGLLTEDMNCFISTAAFGSSLAPQVQTLRDFRNRYLLTSNLGRKLNLLYYSWGSKWSRWLNSHDQFKPVVRAALYPAVWYAKLSLHTNRPVASLLAIFSIFSFGVIGIIGAKNWLTKQ